MPTNDIIKKLKRRQRKEVEAGATKLIAEDITRQADVDRRAALEELAAYDEELGI
jgi:hypothetical protein